MQIVSQGTGNIFIVQDVFFLIIVIVAIFIGLLVGYILGERNRRQSSRYQQKSRYHYSVPQTIAYHFIKFFKKLRYGRSRGVLYAIIWGLFCIFGLSMLEYYYPKTIMDISAIFMIISFIIGFYNAYPLTMWIDRRIPNTDFGIWTRRILAGLMVLVGFGLAFLWLLSSVMAFFALAAQGVTKGPFVSMTAFMVLIASFFFGIGVFGGYMEFAFERRAGILVFTGRQRF